MSRRFSILAGVTLVLLGGISLAFTLVMPLLGASVWMWGAWRLWPLLIVVAGLLFMAAPLLTRGKRGLGALFIPGVPILVNGGILLFASVFDAWHAWEWLWPLELLSVAVGFALAALHTRAVWLLFPAIVVGANGLLLQFCTITGLWESWAVLWTVEPLSIGLALLAVNWYTNGPSSAMGVNLKRRSSGLLAAGIVMCLLAGVGLVESLGIALLSAVLPVGWMWRWVGPVTLVMVGFGVLLWGLTRRAPVPKLAAE